MKKQGVINLVVLLIALSPLGYLMFVFDSIPETFVTRFEFNNAFEEVQSRNELLITTLVLSLVSGLMYLLMRNLKVFDPKVSESTPKSSFNKLGLTITLFFVVTNYLIILAAKNNWVINTSTALLYFGFLVMLIGNFMNNIKPNYVAGIRLPWTLKDPNNWRKTHQLAGKMWFGGGVLLIAASLILPQSVLIVFALVLLIVITVIPGIYSYKLHRNKID
jgi:uncharacterized membrane protein